MRPLRGSWTETASSDPAAVHADFTDPIGESVTDNVAILTGDSLLVVDVDVKNNQPGIASLAKLQSECPLPDTFTVKTPSGGLHFYWAVDATFEYPNRRSWRPGIDIRGYHGIAFALGSSKPGIGDYEIVKDIPVATLPEYFAEQLRQTRRPLSEINLEVDASYEDDWSISAAIDFLKTAEPDAGDGNRHEPLIRIGHELFDMGVTPQSAAQLIEDHWPEAANVGEDIAYQIGNLARGRLKDPTKPWGIDHPRRRPSVYLTFDRVHLPKREDEGPKKSTIGGPLALVSAASLAKREVPPREWLVKDIVPDHAVTILAGDGAVGKSLLALQLGAAVAGETDWIGLTPKHGPVIYASAEDDIDEVHRRLEDITAAQNKRLEDLPHLHIAPLAGRDAVLAAPNATRIITPTALWKWVDAQIKIVRPKLVVLDTLADVFAGNEINRTEVRQFMGMLRGLAVEHELSIVLLSHPSLSGMASGAGTSGSTAWSNSARGRLYLTRPAEGSGKSDSNARTLTIKKANYSGGTGDERALRWEAGRFRPEERDRVTIEADAEALFLSLLAEFTEQGRILTDKQGVSYAPSHFSRNQSAEGTDRAAFARAMDRLFSDGKIKLEEYGPPSRRRTKIILTERKAA